MNMKKSKILTLVSILLLLTVHCTNKTSEKSSTELAQKTLPLKTVDSKKTKEIKISSETKFEDSVEPKREITTPEQDVYGLWPAITEIKALEKTEDGIPIMTISGGNSLREGEITWISDIWKTINFPTFEWTDGARIYFAVNNESGPKYSDLLIRDGKIYQNVLPKLARLETHPGGCAALGNGQIVFSAPLTTLSGGFGDQGVWRLNTEGVLKSVTPALPKMAGMSRDCRSWMDSDGRFVLGLSRLVKYTGSEWEVIKGWYPGRTEMASVDGPRYCFNSCNSFEKDKVGSEAVIKIKEALNNCYARFAVYDDWIVGECRKEKKAARMILGQKPELIKNIPRSRISSGGIISFTPDGDVIFALDYANKSYTVWPVGSNNLSPIRTLETDEILADARPTLLIRGLPPRVPKGRMASTLLGKKISFGAAGSTFGFRGLTRGGNKAYKAQIERAKKVLPRTENLQVIYEAVVDMQCGAYVRSPLGWEGEQIHDWIPPQLPELNPLAVYDPPDCLPLRKVVALPGDPDLLLGITESGILAVAWLPAPLPLPKGYNPRVPIKESFPPKQEPLPGSGWTLIGEVNSVDGISGSEGMGVNTNLPEGSWAIGGGSIIMEQSGKILLVEPRGVYTLPPDTKPMAMFQYQSGVFGAIESQLVFCRDNRCRILDPGVSKTIEAVVPRDRMVVVLGYENGQNGLYQVLAEGGKEISEHPFVSKLSEFLKAKPGRINLQ